MMRKLRKESGEGPAWRRRAEPPPPLDVKLPSFFRCPISLEVMRSPVSLCTGVTYDRSSIQRWLDSGNRFCPATRLPLPSSVDLVPNLNLRRLIRLWSDDSAFPPPPLPPSSSLSAFNLIDELRTKISSSSSGDDDDGEGVLSPLRSLAAFFSSPVADDVDKNRLAANPDFAQALVSVIVAEGDATASAASVVLELAVALLAFVLASDQTDSDHKSLAGAALAAETDRSVPALIWVLKNGGVEARINAARLLESLLSSTAIVADQPDLFPELVRLIKPAEDGGLVDPPAVEAGLRCMLAALASAEGRRCTRTRTVRAGAVPALVRVLVAAEDVPGAVVDMALKAMEAAAGCAAGREAICESAEECVLAVLGRILKAGKEGREAAVAVLWACCVAAGDRRAREAAAAARGGAAKLLVVMQGECSPAAARMAAELLKMFRGDVAAAEICFAGYDTKTIHIMPF